MHKNFHNSQFLPGLDPVGEWQRNSSSRVLEAFMQLRELAGNGSLGGESMPEDSNPGLQKGSSENYHYFTLGMSLNYQRNSYRLWESMLDTYRDANLRWVFSPKEVVLRSPDELTSSLVKYHVALQPNRHVNIWSRLCSTFVDIYSGDIRELFRQEGYDAGNILEQVQKINKSHFPYLSGPKICNYWLHVMERYSDAVLVNRKEISVAPDTHVIQASVRLGLVEPWLSKSSNIQSLTNEAWLKVIDGTELEPIDIHGPLWLWSKSGFKYGTRIDSILGR